MKTFLKYLDEIFACVIFIFDISHKNISLLFEFRFFAVFSYFSNEKLLNIFLSKNFTNLSHSSWKLVLESKIKASSKIMDEAYLPQTIEKQLLASWDTCALKQ